MIYDQTIINSQTILEQFNIQHKDLKFTINEEMDNKITYLDLNSTNKREPTEIEIYRKPTTMDVMINNASCHPSLCPTHTRQWSSIRAYGTNYGIYRICQKG
jgi:hypothetical protein